VFISYHQDDQDEVEEFLDEFEDSFISKVLGVSDEDDFIDSDDTDYIMRRIREKYLTDSTVTIVMIGACTWSRKYVDWEIASTLRNDANNKRSGLLATTLKSEANGAKRLPARLDDNVNRDSENNDIGYARWMKYPKSASSLEAWIEDAYDQRDTEPDNSRDLRERNSTC
jgi:hypothetical protein